MNTNLNFSGSQSEFCDCSEGRSILSPAAYFVDLMKTEAKYLSYYPTKDLLGYFPFHDNTKAIAGNDPITWKVEGKRAFTKNYQHHKKAAFSFDRKTFLESTQKVELGGIFTVALWVKLKDYATEESTLFVLMIPDPGGPGYCSLGVTQGVLTWYLYNTSLNHVTTKIPMGTWTHVAATIDKRADGKANVNLYINGEPVSINTQISTPWQPEKAKIRIGHGQGAYHFNGDMSDLFIYKRSLTPEQISGLYKPSSILTQRRPDLLGVALTDENTYTKVSKLEIVNSILETHAKVDLLGNRGLLGYFPFHGNTSAIAGKDPITWLVKDTTAWVNEKRVGEMSQQTRRRGDAETRRIEVPPKISLTPTAFTKNHQGEENAAFDFDNNTYLESEKEVELGRAFTVALWVNLTEYAVQNSTLFKLKLDQNDSGYCSLIIDPEIDSKGNQTGILKGIFPDTYPTYPDTPRTKVSLGTWTYVAITMDKIADETANINLYINGQPFSINPKIPTKWQPKKAKLQIGDTGVFDFKGAMSDLFIYDRALTADEVKMLRFDVYETLALQSNYPFNLPFDLPLTRIQTYLAKQKTSVAKLAAAINPLVKDMGEEVKANYGQISLYLSQATWHLVSTPVSKHSTLGTYYGLSGITDEQQLVDKLTSLDKFITHTNLSYGQLLELTQEDLSEAEIRSSEHFQNKFFINIDCSKPVVIENAPDDSQIEELKNLNLNNLDRINRFVRLAEAIAFSFTELDWALHTIGAIVNTKDKGNPVISDAVLPYLAWMKELKEEKGFSIDQSAALIGKIKDFGNKEGENTDLLGKIYKRVGIPQIDNQGTQVYADDNGQYQLTWEVGSSDSRNLQIQNSLAAALKVNHTSLLIIAYHMLLGGRADTNAPGTLELTLENLSILYRFSKLPDLLGLSVKESFVALSLLGDRPGVDLSQNSAYLQSLKALTGKQGAKVFDLLGQLTRLADWLKAAGLSVYQLAYLLTGDSQNAAIQNKQLGTDAVKNFLSDLRDHIEPTLFTKERFQDAIHSIGLTNEQRNTAWTNMSKALTDDPAKPQYFWADWEFLTYAAQKRSLLHSSIKYDDKKWSVERDSTTDNQRTIEIKTTGEDNVTFTVDLSNQTVEVATTDPNKTTQVTDPNRAIQVIDPFNGIIAAQTPNADNIKSTLQQDNSISPATIKSLTQTLAKALTHYYQLQHKSLSHQLASLFSVSEKMVAWLERWSGMAMGNVTADEVKKVVTGIATSEPAAVILLQTFLAAIPNLGTKKPTTSEANSLKTATDHLQNLEQYAALVTSFAISPAEAASMVHNPAIYGLSYPTTRSKTKRPLFSLANLQTIFRYKQLVQQFQDRDNKFLGYFSWLLNNPITTIDKVPQRIDEVVQRIIAITAWNKTEVEAFINRDNDKESLFAQWLPTDRKSLVNQWFPTVNFIYFLNQIFSISARLELDIQNLSNLISLADSTPSGTDIEQYHHREQIANLLWSGLQKKDKDQPQTLTNLTNQINGAKRDALVPYVIHELNQKDPTLKLRNPRDLYGYLLIDVEVAGIVPTSYVKDAISTVQLYLYRALNQLEPGVKVDPELNKIWSWMNHYRVWQDNREVFLYPENYIEPELRKQKTPEYKTLENALQQGDLTDPVVVDAAFQAYMNSFVHIAGLDIIGSYAREYPLSQETEATLAYHRDLFLVGRTVKDPKGYYYRLASVKKPKDKASASLKKSKDTASTPFNWQPWLAIDTHMKPTGAVSPIFAFGKWFIFWVELRQSSYSGGGEGEKGYEGTIYYSYLDFNQKWMAPQQLAEPVALPSGIDSIEIAKANNYGQVSVKILTAVNDKENIGISYKAQDFNLAEDFQATKPTSPTPPINPPPPPPINVGGKTATNWTIEQKNGAYFLVKQGSTPTPPPTVRLTSSQALLTALSTALFEGVPQLLSVNSQRLPELNYEGKPSSPLDFFGANGEYYWEIFFHAPFLIAKSLQKQQQFQHAQKWFKYIFNPTVSAANWDILPQEEPNDKYWRFLGLRTAYNHTLHKELNESYTLQEEMIGSWFQEVEKDLKNSAQLEEYHDDPLDAHAIAKLRPIAYQKAIFMSYIDNLIQWGDNLFREYSIESILEATMLYVEAYDLLGNQPTDSGPCDLPDPMNLAQIRTLSQQKTKTKTLQGIPEFLIEIEQSQGSTAFSSAQPTPHNLIPGDYFCLPENAKFIGYWTTIQQRLYNIRHELNIDGVQENLALFQPPINPLALMEAFAAGESIGEALSTLQVALPYYRFDVLIEKAREATQLTIQLGQSVLAALEKNDAEALAILNSNNQQNILSLTSIAKQEQIDQAGQSIQALQASLQNATDRLNHYTELINKGLLGGEKAQTILESLAIYSQTKAQEIKGGAAIAHLFPKIFGFSDGGASPGDAISVGANILEGSANVLSMGSGLAGTQAGFARRAEDWTLQQTIAQDDIDQIKQQILAAQTQQRMAQQDLVILQKNLDQEQKVETFLKSKFTNQQLYQWLIGKSSALYFQAYQLAYELCVTAQRAWQFELGASQNFIQPGYWNNLHHGLLAGEGLQLSLQRMENAFMRQNKRKFEIVKMVSMKADYPKEFENLLNGTCTFQLEQKDFDADYPHHTFRQIKTIALSFPAVLGPYQTIHATLTQTSNTLTWPDGSQHKDFRTNQQVALSQGLNDSGLFELNFNDARYLPFEGTGAVSTWKLEIPTATNPGLISKGEKLDKLTDAIVTLRYTALPK
ncbi:MAG: hypothetical protein F6K41_04040 [Symploca sp. SIO3E6]|nr:hypothetical protein [Caldora sp. SIO3E6]